MFTTDPQSPSLPHWHSRTSSPYPDASPSPSSDASTPTPGSRAPTHTPSTPRPVHPREPSIPKDQELEWYVRQFHYPMSLKSTDIVSDQFPANLAEFPQHNRLEPTLISSLTSDIAKPDYSKAVQQISATTVWKALAFSLEQVEIEGNGVRNFSSCEIKRTLKDSMGTLHEVEVPDDQAKLWLWAFVDAAFRRPSLWPEFGLTEANIRCIGKGTRYFGGARFGSGVMFGVSLADGDYDPFIRFFISCTIHSRDPSAMRSPIRGSNHVDPQFSLAYRSNHHKASRSGELELKRVRAW